MFYKPINDKSGNDTSLITFSHNNSTVGYNKKEYKNRSLASSLMSHLKQRICCGFFAWYYEYVCLYEHITNNNNNSSGSGSIS